MNFDIGIHLHNHYPYQNIGHLASAFFFSLDDSNGQPGLRTTAKQMIVYTGSDTGFSPSPECTESSHSCVYQLCITRLLSLPIWYLMPLHLHMHLVDLSTLY